MADTYERTEVISTIRIRRTMLHLSPFALQGWVLFKNSLFVAAFVLTLAQTWIPGFVEPLRLVAQLVLIWAIQSTILTQHKPGLSFMLVTTRGILISDINVYLDWKEIDAYSAAPTLIRLRTKPGAVPSLMNGPKTIDVPLATSNRTEVKDAFREFVGVPSVL